MSPERKQELQALARGHVALLVNDDLQGHSENLKEVWEQVRDEDDMTVIREALQRIVKWLGVME